MIRHYALFSIATASLCLAACDDTSNATRVVAPPRVGGPSFTIGSGIATTVLGRANAGAFQLESHFNGFNVELNSHLNTDVVVTDNVASVGGNSGWHTHPGPVFVVIKSGALTTYEPDDPNCTPTVHPAGTVLLEQGGHVHYARNEGPGTAEWISTLFVPAGSATRVDAPSPGNCPF